MTEVQVAGSAGMQEAGIFLPTTSAAARSPTVQNTHTYDDHSSQSSFASRNSEAIALKPSTSDVSRSVLPAPVPEDLTPPSSTASPSRAHEHSHDRVATVANGNAHASSTTQSGQVSRSPSASGSQSESIAGSKRTASGQVKIVQHAENPTDHKRTDMRHERASSSVSVSSTSNVIEIGQQLRTRLKYAMVKVQNGWQTRSLDELESIASASPKSHASPFVNSTSQGSPFSPRAVAGSKMNRKWSDSSSSEGSPSEPRLSALTSSHLIGVDSHKNGRHPARSLAPPADIVPGFRRRPTPNEIGLKPASHRQYQSRPTSQRTPSQHAAMEADAVETLLFMASPNNSGYHPASQVSQESSLRSALQFSAQTSPLRTQFSQSSLTSPKKVAFSDQGPPTLTATKSEIIDNMIDSVPDESDSELEAALSLAGQRAAKDFTA